MLLTKTLLGACIALVLVVNSAIAQEALNSFPEGSIVQDSLDNLSDVSDKRIPLVVRSKITSPQVLDGNGLQQSVELSNSVIVKANLDSYSWNQALDDVKSIKWEGLGAFAGVTALGVKSWDWGSSSFHFNDEHWFGKNTGSGGTDKLGHAFTSYALTNAFAERLQAKGRSPQRAALSAGLMTTALMLYVEAFDGVSGDHGFSYEDVIMNSLGTGFAYLRQTHPKLKSLVDYRMEYKPSGYKGFRPFSDYEGQKYLFALKLSGFNRLKQTPLRFVELQAGYYSRGFSKDARNDGHLRAQHGFVGIGLNLSQLLFGYPSDEDKAYEKVGRFAFEHIQVPYTSVRSENK